ncbi:MAG: tRNA (N(6)-L-threonylcarbamoyladenosine(37)-C(2))-methylthiotransferase MtaB, partial [Lachnospiraceae bacterium]|nr:tRNA (N(6)-L-threonylcarbamoyladenosine(37)-C(2))-methylthiotransferase MtaB [Lachnospiraceae bacterium]
MRVAFHTLGCKVNAYETQAILEQFQENGFTIVDFQDAADVYIVNTCSV